MDREEAIKYALTGLAFLLTGSLSEGGSIDNQILGVVILALILWSLYPKRHLESSILVVVLIAVFEANLDVQELIDSIFSAYGGSGLWMIISGFVLAKGMEESGLGKRIALTITTSMGCKPRNIILAVAVASLVISPLSPSTTAKAFLILPICVGLIEAFGIEKGGSNYGAAVMLMAMTANNICGTAFLTATVPNPISASYLSTLTGLHLDWFGWFKMAFPITVALLAMSYLLVIWVFKPEVEASKETSEKMVAIRDKLGPFTRNEKIVAIIFAFSLELWIFENYLPFNTGLISLALSLALFLPQAGVVEVKKFGESVPWGSIALFAASMFLAKAVDRYRALDPVAQGLFKVLGLESMPDPIFVTATVLAAMLLHLVFTSTTVYATVMVPLVIELTRFSGLDPLATALPVVFLVPIAVLLPVNTIPNIIFHSEGYFTTKQMFAYGLVLSLLSVALVMLLGIPYWQACGLI